MHLASLSTTFLLNYILEVLKKMGQVILSDGVGGTRRICEKLIGNFSILQNLDKLNNQEIIDNFIRILAKFKRGATVLDNYFTISYLKYFEEI